MSADTNEAAGQENQAKFCQSHILQTEKTLGSLCDLFASLTRKIARVRDKGDLVAKQLNECAKTEACGHSMKAGLSQCAYNLSAIQDYRQAEIQRLEGKVVRRLSDYGNICRQVKGGIKSEVTAIKKENKSVKSLEKVRNKSPGDAHRIAETELKKASTEASIGSKALQEQMMVFEKDRLKDLKNVLSDFINIEMVFHAKALEYYTKCFESVTMIDDDRDLTEFARKLVNSKGVSRPDMTLSSFNSSTDYSDTLASASSGTFDSTTSSKRRVQINENNSRMYGDEDDEDDDEDYDDDDYDYNIARR